MKGRFQAAIMLLILTAGCIAVVGRPGIMGEAIRKDMDQMYRRKTLECKLSRKEWEKRCVEDFYEKPADCPPECPNVDDY